jgi:type IV pilus assembly protein PilW
MNSQSLKHKHRFSGPYLQPGPRRQTQHSQSGFTLIELMVALTISVVLIAGVLQIYTTSSKSYRSQKAAAHLMEDGRTAIELLSRSLRLGGYWKCVGWQAANLSNHLPSNQRGLFGTDGANGAPDTLRTLHALDETAVTVQAEVELTELIVDNSVDPPAVTVTPKPITVSSGAGFDGNELIVINDCAKGDVFPITGVNADTLSHNCTTCVEVYGINSTVLEVEDTRYFIADNDRTQPSLYQSVNSGGAEELFEGVEDMQVFYGEDTDSDGVANRYVTAEVINAPCAALTNANCWLRVTSVRISLLLRTFDINVTLAPQTYNYNGATVTAPGDGRLRRVFTAVVSLRNHRI